MSAIISLKAWSSEQERPCQAPKQVLVRLMLTKPMTMSCVWKRQTPPQKIMARRSLLQAKQAQYLWRIMFLVVTLMLMVQVLRQFDFTVELPQKLRSKFDYRRYIDSLLDRQFTEVPFARVPFRLILILPQLDPEITVDGVQVCRLLVTVQSSLNSKQQQLVVPEATQQWRHQNPLWAAERVHLLESLVDMDTLICCKHIAKPEFMQSKELSRVRQLKASPLLYSILISLTSESEPQRKADKVFT